MEGRMLTDGTSVLYVLCCLEKKSMSSHEVGGSDSETLIGEGKKASEIPSYFQKPSPHF